jgi:hypothetical protein
MDMYSCMLCIRAAVVGALEGVCVFSWYLSMSVDEPSIRILHLWGKIDQPTSLKCVRTRHTHM